MERLVDGMPMDEDEMDEELGRRREAEEVLREQNELNLIKAQDKETKRIEKQAKKLGLTINVEQAPEGDAGPVPEELLAGHAKEDPEMVFRRKHIRRDGDQVRDQKAKRYALRHDRDSVYVRSHACTSAYAIKSFTNMAHGKPMNEVVALVLLRDRGVCQICMEPVSFWEHRFEVRQLVPDVPPDEVNSILVCGHCATCWPSRRNTSWFMRHVDTAWSVLEKFQQVLRRRVDRYRGCKTLTWKGVLEMRENVHRIAHIKDEHEVKGDKTLARVQPKKMSYPAEGEHLIVSAESIEGMARTLAGNDEKRFKKYRRELHEVYKDYPHWRGSKNEPNE